MCIGRLVRAKSREPLGGASGAAMAMAPLVLVVDDDEDGREACVEYLRLCDYRVESAADGIEGLAKARQLLPDLILMDLELPELGGLEVTRILKGEGRTHHIPIAAYTASALPEMAAEAAASGCDAIILKPIPPSDLVSEVHRLLAGRR